MCVVRLPRLTRTASYWPRSIRNGTIVDWRGGDPYEADLAVADGRIAAIGGSIPKGAEEIDARGKLVTPGVVDAHALRRPGDLERAL